MANKRLAPGRPAKASQQPIVPLVIPAVVSPRLPPPPQLPTITKNGLIVSATAKWQRGKQG